MSPEDDEASGEAVPPEGDLPEVAEEALREDAAGGDEAEGEGQPPSEMFRGMMAQMQQFGPAPHPLADQITSDHIDSLIEIQSKNSDNLLEDRKGHRYHVKFVFVAACVFVLALVGLLAVTGNVEQVESLITQLVVLAGGGLGGYGIAKAWRQ